MPNLRQTFFPLTGRGRFLFDVSKRKWGWIPCGKAAYPRLRREGVAFAPKTSPPGSLGMAKRKWGGFPAENPQIPACTYGKELNLHCFEKSKSEGRFTPHCAPASTGDRNTVFAGGRSPPWPAGPRHRPPPPASPAPGSGPCTARPAPSGTGPPAWPPEPHSGTIPIGKPWS